MSDNIYLNITVPGTVPIVSADVLPASFNVSYTEPIVNKASDYYMAIVKFQIPLLDVPILVMPVIPGQNPPPNQPFITPFTVGVCQQQNVGTNPNPTAINFPVNLLYQSADQFLSTNTQLSSTIPYYFFIYSYNFLISMLNTALHSSWVAAGSPGGSTPQGDNAPYYIYEPATNLIKIIMPYDFIHAPAAPNFHWTIFSNQYQLGFYDVQNNGRFEIWTPVAETNNSYIALAPYPTLPNNARGSGATYVFSQEYPTVEYTNSITKIIITSNSLPVQKEFFPRPGNTNQSEANSVGILTDFYLDLNNKAGTQRSIAVYISDLYRLIDLKSDEPIRKVDLNFFWANNANEMFPITLPPDSSISMKLGFFSKKLYRNSQLKYL